MEEVGEGMGVVAKRESEGFPERHRPGLHLMRAGQSSCQTWTGSPNPDQTNMYKADGGISLIPSGSHVLSSLDKPPSKKQGMGRENFPNLPVELAGV